MSEHRSVPEGQYKTVPLDNAAYTEGMEIDFQWNSTVAIDVWVMDKTQFDLFDSGKDFGAEGSSHGTTGSLRVSLVASQVAVGLVYVVFDNSARGDTMPPADAVDAVAEVNVTGRVWKPVIERYTTLGPTATSLDLLFGMLILIPTALVFAVLWSRYDRTTRRARIRKDLADGKVVGRGISRPIIPYSGPAPGRPTQTASLRFCRSCGSPLASGKAFCTKCGTKI